MTHNLVSVDREAPHQGKLFLLLQVNSGHSCKGAAGVVSPALWYPANADMTTEQILRLATKAASKEFRGSMAREEMYGEAQILASLNSPDVPQLYGVIAEEGYYAIVMQLCDSTLQQVNDALWTQVGCISRQWVQ